MIRCMFPWLQLTADQEKLQQLVGILEMVDDDDDDAYKVKYLNFL